ncbi:MAG: plastocyanin/azurin family copper-binding protein [Bacteroidia bacterium]|nr:plastocyanin/azurin family copper-binding protein [Bacteroidia bacterium]
MKNFLILILTFCLVHHLSAQINPQETAFYRIETLPIPSDLVLEIGGMTFNDRDQLTVCTRRGEVWEIENPYTAAPRFRRFAQGLHEPLGIAWNQGQYYVTQRGELTRLKDKNNDGRADTYETVYSWPLSGNYHEYSYGPLILPNGDMILTLNLGWDGKGVSWAPWRGWMIKVSPKGQMTPVATGFRSPAGFGFNTEGDIFYAENQGDWVGSGRMTHVEVGDFVGNPSGLRWASDPASPVKVREENVPDGQGTLYEAGQKVPGIKPPSVWFPHTLMGISTSDIKTIPAGTAFGPFAGQMLVGDQGHSKIMRVFQEKIEGVWQGICFPFLEGFSSGILRLEWGKNSTLFVGMTSRGWSATGQEEYGIQRVKWTGKTPFEMKAVYARPDGFEIEFTQPVDAATATALSSYSLTSFTYNYHHIYGSPVVGQQPCEVKKAELSADRTRVRLYVAGIRKGFIHEIKATGVRAEGKPLLHEVGYYTLNRIPSGEKMAMDHNMNHTGTSGEVRYNPAKYIPQMPADWGGKIDQTLVVGTLPGLKFDKTTLEVRAGARVKLEFNNPDDMQHNLVIGKPGSVDAITKLSLELGLEGSNQGFIPDSELILFHTSLMQPHSVESIYFKAPSQPGEYDFVCTYPGHAMVMRGKLVVR